MVKQRNTSSLQRKKIKGQERKLILIVVEGEETEVIYFNSLKKELRLTNVSIEVESSKHIALRAKVRTSTISETCSGYTFDF